MDKKVEQMFAAVKDGDTVILATAGAEGVTMRLVSPVYYQEQVLIFTSPQSRKYRQLQADPRCCLAVGGFFVQCRAKFCGPTMDEANAGLRAVYSGKFPGAFEQGVEFGGQAADFILLKPVKVSGWAFADDAPAPGDIPTIPFELALK